MHYWNIFGKLNWIFIIIPELKKKLPVFVSESGVINYSWCMRSMPWVHRRETHPKCIRVGRYKILVYRSEHRDWWFLPFLSWTIWFLLDFGRPCSQICYDSVELMTMVMTLILSFGHKHFTALLIYLPTLKHCMLYGFLVVYYLLQLFKFDGKIWPWAFIAIEAILL